jgi:dipeptidyl aminopeptidase/acylaminoacyl peptidase
MTSFDRFDRFERNLPGLFDELATARTPDYFDDILARTAATRQRPGWSFPERWLPMSALSQRLAGAPRVPWRLAAVVALLLVAAIIAILVAGGAGRQRLPAPFGVAGNGQVAYLDPAGQILLGDVVTGETHVVMASETAGNSRPIFSPDGTRLAYLRRDGAAVEIVIVKPDGSDLRVITSDPIPSPGFMAWSPKGDAIVVTHNPGTLELYATTGPNAPRDLSRQGDVGAVTIGNSGFLDRTAQLFRPPTGSELLFVNHHPDATLAAIKPDGTGYRELLNADSGLAYSALSAAQWSPDGSQVVVNVEFPVKEDWSHLYVLNADGTNLRPLQQSLDPLIGDGVPMWSPDGTMIAFQRWTAHADGDGQDFHKIVVVDVATGSSREVGRVSYNGYRSWEWSPDGKSILAVPDDGTSDVMIINAITGDYVTAAFSTDAEVSWQRTAP